MIHLLLVEDDESSAELTLGALRSGGLVCACERVTTEGEFRAALARGPDIVLSDSNIPGFDGLEALAITRAACPTTPFIFVSGQLNDAASRRAYANGATGYVNKADLSRLARKVRSALRPAPRASRGTSEQSEVIHDVMDPRDPSNTASYLLERRSILDRALRHEDRSSLASVLSRSPPTPAALVMIRSHIVRERYVKILHNARIDTELSADSTDAKVKLAERTHALLFTDDLDLIREARQLSAGSATHIVLVGPESATVTMEALRAGADDLMPEDARGDQFWARLTIARRIVSFAASLQSALTDNRILSTIDELTRCGNRRYFEEQFPREIARAARLRRPLALVVCDIDNFKDINDVHGHQLGDEVLRQVGGRLTHGLRLGEDWVARTGGEEFAIVLPDTGRFKALAVAQRLRDRIGRTAFATSAQFLKVTASFGVCAVQAPTGETADLAEAMLAAADAALYQSKRDGRNRVTDAAQLNPKEPEEPKLS
jgi:diguanylate cyclase (GGDEF)-like protein